MKRFGRLLAVTGTLAVLTFPPYELLGEIRWGFVFDSVVAVMGRGVHVYDLIHWPWLLAEVAAVNGVAILLMNRGR